MKMQRFPSALVRLKLLFKVRPPAQPVKTDYRDLMPKMETLP